MYAELLSLSYVSMYVMSVASACMYLCMLLLCVYVINVCNICMYVMLSQYARMVCMYVIFMNAGYNMYVYKVMYVRTL